MSCDESEMRHTTHSLVCHKKSACPKDAALIRVNSCAVEELCVPENSEGTAQGRTTADQATLIERSDQRGRTYAACRYRRYTHAVTMERGGNAGTPSPRNGDRPQSYAGYRAFPSSLDSLSVAEGTPPVVAAGKFAASGQGGPPPSRAASLGNRCRWSCVFVRVCLLSRGHV